MTRHHAVRMAADAFQLTIVFTIVPVIPLAIVQAHLMYGVWAALIVAMLFYGGFPSALGGLMWVSLTRKRGTICETTAAPTASRANEVAGA